MSFYELKVYLPVTVPQGNGFAIAVIDYGSEHHLLYVTVLDETGEIVTIANPDVRVRPNFSMRAPRNKPSKIDAK
jgi:hypothetical protein